MIGDNVPKSAGKKLDSSWQTHTASALSRPRQVRIVLVEKFRCSKPPHYGFLLGLKDTGIVESPRGTDPSLLAVQDEGRFGWVDVRYVEHSVAEVQVGKSADATHGRLRAYDEILIPNNKEATFIFLSIAVRQQHSFVPAPDRAKEQS